LVLEREASAFNLLTTIFEKRDLNNIKTRRIKIPITILLKLIPKTPSFQIEITISKKLSIVYDISVFD
jgi:hypothetical protein